MGSELMGFSVAFDRWIPVMRDFETVEASVLDVLVNAHEIDGLAVHAPLETVAVLRQVLLPVYLDAMFGEGDLAPPVDEDAWEEWWQRGRVDGERIEAYLRRHADRFELFGPTPFAQAAGLSAVNGATKPVSLLIAAAASGNNVPLFSARSEANPPALTAAQAARALLATQCWDTAGLKTGAVDDRQVRGGKTSGNVTGPLGGLGVVAPFGRTLFETLMLHTPIQPQPFRSTDRPQWRADPHGAEWQRRPALGLLDLLTWQARRIRLVPEERDGETVVRQVVVTAGDRLTETPQDIEPHTAWKPSSTTQAQVPVRHTPGRAAWRGMQALLAVDPRSTVTSSLVLRRIAGLQVGDCLPRGMRLQVMTVGIQYGTQSAVVEEVITDQIPLPLAALAPGTDIPALLEEIVSNAEDLRVAANRFGDELREAAGGGKLSWNQGQRIGDTLIHQFTPVVHRILGGLQGRPDLVDEARDAWRVTARRLAHSVIESALSTVPPTAFLGRMDGKHPRRENVAIDRYRRAVDGILGVPATTSPTGGA